MSLMRTALLKASENEWLRTRAPQHPFVRRTVARFLPGENLEDAIGAAQRLASLRIDTLLTHLGENVTDRAEAESVTGHYLQVIDRIRTARLPSEISVKLTQLGLDLDREFCCANLAQLIERLRAGSAPPQKVVWIDMEHSPMWTTRLKSFRVREDNIQMSAFAFRPTCIARKGS